jgi:hypothetical protein
MEQIKEKHLDKNFVRSDEAKRIIASLQNLDIELIASHKKTNTPLVVSIDGKIVHIKPEDL